MDDSRADGTGEVERLDGWVDELATVLATPAAATGVDAVEMVDALAETVLRALALDFVYVRLDGPTADRPLEITKQARHRSAAQPPSLLAALVRRWLEQAPESRPGTLPGAGEKRPLSLVASRLGLHDELGTLVAGAERAEFPRRTDRLLLTVAANQAALALQELRHRGERKRLTEIGRASCRERV